MVWTRADADPAQFTLYRVGLNNPVLIAPIGLDTKGQGSGSIVVLFGVPGCVL